MSGMDFSSHGSQDLFPTMLEKQIGLDADKRIVTVVVINLGAMFGGLSMGQLSELLGRRLTHGICCTLAAALIYPTLFSKTQSRIIAAGFFKQGFVMGSWGVIPISLIKLSPPAFRSLFGRLAFQLGNLVSPASSTIEADSIENYPLPEVGRGVNDYGKVMALFMSGGLVFLLLCFILGPEKFHIDLTAGAEENHQENVLTIPTPESLAVSLNDQNRSSNSFGELSSQDMKPKVEFKEDRDAKDGDGMV